MVRRLPSLLTAFLVSAFSFPAFPATVVPSFQPVSEVGTRMERIGVAGWLDWLDDAALPSFVLGTGALVEHGYANLGMPGTGAVCRVDVHGALGLGEVARAGSPWVDPPLARRFMLYYVWMAYFDSWGTGQRNGLIELLYRLDDVAFGLAVQNDLFGLYSRDEYRTAAVELATWIRMSPVPMAFFLGLKVWTVNVDDNAQMHWGSSTAPPDGATSSVGIFYGGAKAGPFKFLIGWDSEAVRAFFQNGFHRLFNCGYIFPTYQDAGRLYLSLMYDRPLDLY